MTISRTLRSLATACLLALAAGRANAGSVFYAGGLTVNNYNLGYGLDKWDEFTAVLDAATSDRVTVGADFSDLGQMLAHDALFVAARKNSAARLSDVELDNLATFIATGRRVLFVGEYNYRTIITQFLDLVGGELGTGGAPDATAVIANEITAGASMVHVSVARTAVGGTPLYDTAFATLWGENVLTVLDMSVFSDSDWDEADNAQFAANVAGWLAASQTAAVPEPASVVTLGLACGLLAGVAARRRSAAPSI